MAPVEGGKLNALENIITSESIMTNATCAGGFHVDPVLPMHFDRTKNASRPASHRNWWGIPYIVTHKDEAGVVEGYTVRRLDGGAWDRSVNHGSADTLEGAVAICQRIAADPMRFCSRCESTTMARYWGPMATIREGVPVPVEVCPVCGDMKTIGKESAKES